MSARYNRTSEHRQLTSEELDKHYVDQALERQKRGMIGFTRKERERDITNRVPGMASGHDIAQKARERRGGSR